MLINYDSHKSIYVLGQSVQSEELVEFIRRDHEDTHMVHHDNISTIVPGSQCIIGFTNIDYRIRTITQLKNTMQWPSYIHPNSIVEPTVTIGIGCVVYPMSTLLHRAAIDDFSAVFTHVHISHGAILGKNVVVCPGVIIGGSTTIGDNVLIGQTSSIRDKISITNNVNFFMSSTVTRDIIESGTYYGNKKVPNA